MADTNYCEYDSAEDDPVTLAALNDRYDALPEGVELESSESDVPEPEEEEEDEEETTESETEGVDPKNGKYNDPDYDPFNGWDKLAGTEPKIPDLTKLLLDDPDLQDMWQNQADEQETETEEEDDDDDDDIFGEEEKVVKRSDDDDDDDEDNPLSSGDDSDDDPRQASTEPPTPVPLEMEAGAAEPSDPSASEADNEESDFSLGDIATEPEEEPEESAEEENNNKGEGDEGDGEESGVGENKANEDEDEDEADDEEEIPLKKYRKIPKDSDDSDPTEWETITEHSEGEASNEGENEGEEEKEEEEEIVEAPKTPDPYSYTELHTNIEHIEEFDDNFDEKFKAKYKSSASSSTDESAPEKGEYDVEDYTKDHHRRFSVVKANKNKDLGKKNQKRRRVSVINNGGNKNELSKTGKGSTEKNKMKDSNNHKITSKKEKGYFIDLNVYNFDFPRYSSAEQNEDQNEKEENVKEDKGDQKSKKKRKKVKKLKPRKYLDTTYDRCHPWYKDSLKLPDVEYPSASIPSYKVQARTRQIKERTVQLALDKVLTQTFEAIEDIERMKLRKEATHHSQFFLFELADNVVGEIEEFQERDAVRYAIEVLLDKWEGKVYDTRKSMIEEQLEKVSETIVTNAITKLAAEVANEDWVASLAVRDSFAGALDDLGKDQARITRTLYHMFGEYNFDEYDFDKGGTKMKQKRHRTRRDLDNYLKARADRLKDDNILISPLKKKRERKKKQKKKILSEIEEEKKGDKHKEKEEFDNEREEEEEEEELRWDKDPICLSPTHLSEAEEVEVLNSTKEVASLEQMNQVSHRERRRSSAVAIWLDTDKKLLQQLREKNQQWNSMYEENEEKEEVPAADKDFNALYAMSDEEKGGEDDDSDADIMSSDKKMPDLGPIVDQALVDPKVEIIVEPVLPRLKAAPPSVDSAVDSEEEEEEDPAPPKRKVAVVASPAVPRRDTGISSIASVEDVTNLTGKALEKEKPIKELIKLIPTIDRDQFLNDWLVNGGPKRIPTPPERPPDRPTSRARRFHLKRPGTAESIASIRDVVPLESRTYKHYQSRGRLNSAKSSRSSGRPESARSIYTERSSLHSGNEDCELSSELESDEEEKAKTNQNGKKGGKRKNTKIEFDKTKSKGALQQDEKYEKAIESSAWNFYLKQNRELRKLQERIEEEGRPQLLEDIVLPEKNITEEDLQEILNKYGNVEINGMYDDEEEDVELLKLAEQDNGSNDDDDDDDDEANKKNSRSITPPSTPWERQKNRPITPDSVDSDQELGKIKKKFFEQYDKKQQGQLAAKQPGRLYKQYLRRKDTSLPPPPKIGWQPPTQGLIHWKTAEKDMKKVRGRRGSAEHANTTLNRNLFNQLQITVKRGEKKKAPRPEGRLLHRRATLHTEQISMTKLEKRKKVLPKDVEPGSVSPRSTRSIPRTTRSIPSYARTTKAATMRKAKQDQPEEVKLPKLTANSKTSSKKAKTARK